MTQRQYLDEDGKAFATTVEIPVADLKKFLVFLSLDEHPGDVADSCSMFAKAIGWEGPEWSDEKERVVWSFDSEVFEWL
jgi:hypothetical protein